MSTAEKHRVEYLPLDDVQPAPHNPRVHNLDGLRTSISRFGFAAPALRDERTGLLVAGHGRTLALRAMRDAGETAPSGVQIADDGRWLVPVTCGWASRSDAEAAAYLVADNRQSELASWDNAGLGDLLTSIGESDPDLVGIAGYTDDDLAALLSTVADVEADQPESLTDPDDVPGLAHPSAIQVWWGGNHYAASAGLPDSSCWLVWDKENTGNFADAELAWTNHCGAVRLLRHMWNGMLRASERGKRVHPTQKPVALAEWAFEQVDRENMRLVVLDLFGGSGSTLIAAYRTGRRCAMIEMEPAYVDVICRRFQEFTGVLPVLAETGEPHDFTTAPR